MVARDRRHPRALGRAPRRHRACRDGRYLRHRPAAFEAPERNMKRRWFVAAFVFAAATAARADTVIGLTSRSGDDLADWGHFFTGTCGPTIPDGFHATSSGGVGITGTFAGGGDGYLFQQQPSLCASWAGGFSAADWLLGTSPP